MTINIQRIQDQVSLLMAYTRGAIDINENCSHQKVLIKIQIELTEIAKDLIPGYEKGE